MSKNGPIHPDECARREVSIAQLTAKAELVIEELTGVIVEMAEMLRKGASDAQ